MVVPNPRQARLLAGFIRGVLGCGCPDEVLADLRLTAEPVELDGLPLDALIDVGGRLLVAICIPSSVDRLEPSLPAYLAAGKRLRDQQGFNRFRLVVATADPGSAEALLLGRWEALTESDDRLHLHVVDREVLAQLGA